MEEKVRAAVRQHGLLRGGERVVVAVSGGADSVALLHLLWRWRAELGLALHVAHLNHRLRQEADEEAEFVRRLARDLGLPVTVGVADVRSLAGRAESLEDVARRVRRRFLTEVAAREGATRIALGHQANDQAETVLLHLLRGSGPAGLAGMTWQSGLFIRPLLAVTRAETEAYCAENALPYLRDPSNADPAFLRNRIRSELLPLLAEKYNPNIVAALGQTAAILAEEDRHLEEELDRVWPELLAPAPAGEVRLRASGLAALPPALRRRAVRRAFFAVAGREDHFLGYRHVEEVLAVLLARPGRRLHLPRGVTAAREGGEVVFCRGGKKTPPTEVVWPVCRRLSVPGQVRLAGWCIGAEPAPEGAQAARTAGPWETYCDRDRLSPPLFVRFWQPGDSFRPLGLGGQKKLQDFFVDAKVPREQRSRIPLVVCSEGIVWVVGYRLDERFRVRPDTTAVLRLYAVREEN